MCELLFFGYFQFGFMHDTPASSAQQRAKHIEKNSSLIVLLSRSENKFEQILDE